MKWSRLIYHSKSGQNVWFSNGTIKLDHFIYNNNYILTIQKPDKMSRFRIIGTITMKTDLQKVRFSNDSGFWRVGFRIPTVLETESNHLCWLGLNLLLVPYSGWWAEKKSTRDGWQPGKRLRRRAERDDHPEPGGDLRADELRRTEQTFRSHEHEWTLF